MPDQLATLQPYLELHEADLARMRKHEEALLAEIRRPPRPQGLAKRPLREILRRNLAQLQRTIATHERFMELARDPRVGELLHAVAEDSRQAREAAADPRAFAARTGLELPETLVVHVWLVADEVFARIVNLDDDMPFDITWSRDGFPPPPQLG